MTDALPPQTPANDGLRRWLGPALLVSLVINLFLLGLIATAIVSHRDEKRMEFRGPPQPFFGMMRRGAADLPPDDRAAIRDIMVQQFPIIRPYFARIDMARKDLAATIGTTPYDPQKVAEAFAKIDTAQSEMVKATREAMIRGFGKMTDEQRARLADAMRKQAERRLNSPGPGAVDGPPPGGPDALGLGGPPPPGGPDGRPQP